MCCASSIQQLRSSLQGRGSLSSASSSSSAIYPIANPLFSIPSCGSDSFGQSQSMEIVSQKELILDKTTRLFLSLQDDGIGITSAEFTSHTGFKHGTSPRLVFGLCSSRLRSRGFVAEQLPVRQLRQPRQPRPDIKHKVGKSTSTCH
ncbi:hypothetical protein V8C43DRAFT_91226 [Trichoderma afarasin]